MKSKKLVFSKDKWYEVMSTKVWPYYMNRIPTKQQAFKVSKWVHDCHGLTSQQMQALGYVEPDPAWMVESIY